jgi:hypothetical protein
MQQSPRPGRFILVKESASSGLRAAKMNDNLFYRTHAVGRLAPGR